MKVLVSKSKIGGRVAAPSSKSYTIRALVCAALAPGESEIVNPLGSDDTEACLDVLGGLGIEIRQENESWLVVGGNLRQPGRELYCRESAATQRFMTAVCALAPGKCRLTAAPSLAKRPLEPLLNPLRQLGVKCEYEKTDSSVTVHGGGFRGGTAELPGNISSQYVSSLLFISPFAPEGMTVRITTPLESWPYVLMTLECLRAFGIRIEHSDDLRELRTARQTFVPARYRVEGDWSSASCLLAAGALAGGITVENLNPDSLQADKKLLDFLTGMGAGLEIRGNTITIGNSKLKAIRADLTDCPDLLPAMGVLAAAAHGTSELTGIERARIKESDRVSSVRTGLERMGIKVIEERNRLVISGSPVKGAVIDSAGDHRIAMAFGVLGMIAGNTVIENAQCVSKTYPEFWDILGSIGGEVNADV